MEGSNNSGVFFFEQNKAYEVKECDWGSDVCSSDLLGIPVGWGDISQVGAIVETFCEKLRVEPSQGSHFFHNIITLGVNYITVSDTDESFLDWEWLESLPTLEERQYVAHVRLDRPMTLKVDGRTSRGVMFLA